MSRTSCEILLVDPPSEVNLNLPNLQLAFAAALLKAPVVDLHALPFPRSRLLKWNPDNVFVSFRSYNRDAAEGLRERLKERNPACRVRSLQGIVDVQCCYAFESWNDPFRLETEFGDALPFPGYERFDSCRYLQANWKSGFWGYPLLTSLGCPFSCEFCSARRRPWKSRSVGHVIEELRRAQSLFGIISFEILDDVFNLHEERVLEFCRAVKPLGLTWSCVNGLRVDRFTEAQARAMADAGCVHAGFGLESLDAELLERSQKGITPEQIERAITLAGASFKKVGGFFVLGLPGATEEKDRKTLEWARQQGIAACFSYWVPPERKGSGARYYGHSARPDSPAYATERQMALYREARLMNRTRYVEEGVLKKVLCATIHSFAQWGATECLNHGYHVVKRGLSALTTGDLQ